MRSPLRPIAAALLLVAGCFPTDTLESGPAHDVAQQEDGVIGDGASSGASSGTSGASSGTSGASSGTSGASSGTSGASSGTSGASSGTSGASSGTSGASSGDGGSSGTSGASSGDGGSSGTSSGASSGASSGDGGSSGTSGASSGGDGGTSGSSGASSGDGGSSGGDPDASSGSSGTSGASSGGADAGADAVVLPPAGCLSDADCAASTVACMRNACDLGSGACGLLPDDGKACDDGNACTTADTCALGACKPGAATCSCQSDADCAGKDDGNPCNGTLWCAPTTKTCATKPGSAIACGDDGNPCTAAVCDPKGGSCAHLPVEGIACDDDNSCTSDDHCKAGACAGGKTTCPCQTNADCANVPTDKCASVLLCDAIAKTCVPTPASKKKCPPDATSCTKTSCDPKTGQCVSKVLQGPCDDGDPCTQGDHCLGGGCEPGALACSCNADADCAPLDNADLCDAKLTCQQGQCAVDPATAIACVPHHTPACGTTGCDPKTGQCAVTANKDGTICNDNDNCTIGDQCEAGACKATKTTCPCGKLADCAAQDDGDACNGKQYCDPISGGCKTDPATVPACPDGGPCTVAICDKKTGKCGTAPGNDGKPCDGAQPCEKAQCKGGECAATAQCGCTNHAQCAAIGGNKCLPGFCDSTTAPWTCKPLPGAEVWCPDGDVGPCKTRQCDPKTGQCATVNAPDFGLCDDDSSCTIDTSCKGGQCTGGNNVCKCTKDSDCAGLDSKNQCTGKHFCYQKTGKCLINPATVPFCDPEKSTTCANHICSTVTGKCVFSPNFKATTCDDNNPCTVSDTCVNAKCVGKNTCKCLSDNDCKGLDSPNKCLGVHFCDRTTAPWTCKKDPATNVTCKQGNNPACKTNKCDEKTGKCGFFAVNDGTKCEDGDSCTTDWCKGGSCVLKSQNCACFSHADCQKKDDGNLCNGTLYCDFTTAPYTCKSDPKGTVKCDDKSDTACVKNQCDPKTGLCSAVPQSGQACDDGVPCTKSSACKAGKCVGTSGCECTKDSDCAAKEDGNACNGTLYCHPASGECKIDPNSFVECPVDLSGAPCTTLDCIPQSGKCAKVPKKGDVPCKDGNSCTTDKCVDGKCGGPSTCSCNKDADCASKDDGLPCNGTVSCVAGKCEVDPATIPNCQGDDDEQCARKVCNLNTGACITKNTDKLQCNDGRPCWVNDFCKDGKCRGEVKICKCTPEEFAKPCAFLNGGNPCAPKIYCDTSKGAPNYECKLIAGSAPLCSSVDDTFCAANKCDPNTGKCAMTAANDNKLCNDNNPCTVNDFCAAGSCVGQTRICQCEIHADCKSQDDGDPCNGIAYCDQASHTCKPDPSTAVLCDPAKSTECAEHICWPSTGTCKVTPKENILTVKFLNGKPDKKVPGDKKVLQFVPCDDGDACTANDECVGGKCKIGPVQLCECINDQDCASHPATTGCTGPLYCDVKFGKCKVNAATQVHCDSKADHACATNECDPKTGKCALKPVFGKFKPCADGNSCTAGDYCEGGKCLFSANVCKCNSDAECNPGPADKCKTSYFCNSKGQCQVDLAKTVWCDPALGGPCTVNACDPATGACKVSAKPEKSACDDGIKCTVNDRCVGGKCVGGGKGCECLTDADCDSQESGAKCVMGLYCNRAPQPWKCSPDPRDLPLCKGVLSGCTADACDPGTGACKTGPMPDATACDDGQPCTLLSFCKGGACKPGASVCNCATDKDCVGKGDHCTGPLYCDKSTAIAHCRPNPATQPFCPQPPPQDCKVAFCDAAAKSCSEKVAADDTPCGAGKVCSGGNCL